MLKKVVTKIYSIKRFPAAVQISGLHGTDYHVMGRKKIYMHERFLCYYNS